MRNISFFLTQRQFRERSKTVTRRLGWKRAKPGDILMGVVKGQGIPKGTKAPPGNRLGPIIVEDVRAELLNRMIDNRDYGFLECVNEGFPEMSPGGFVEMFTAHNHCKPDETITRIEFGYLDHISCLEEDDANEMLGKVTIVDGDKSQIELPQPADWFRRMERRKGIFSNTPATLRLIKSGHDWVDIFFLKKWKIRRA